MPNTIEQQLLASLGLPSTQPATSTSYDTNNGKSALLLRPETTSYTANGNAANSPVYDYIFGFGGNDMLALYISEPLTLDNTYTLIGGAGADTYKFSAYGTLTIYVNIADFSTADGDKIDISATGLSFSDLTLTVHNVQDSSWTTVTGANLHLEVRGEEDDLSLNAASFLLDDEGGSSGNDVLTGTASADTLLGLGGNDTVSGLGGNDSLNGNLGNDSVLGGDGNDSVAGGQGIDFVNGNAGTDTVNGNLGDDYVYGGQGNDVVRGGQGSDYVFGNLGEDSVFGDFGNDYIRGGAGNDSISGGGGIDNMWGDLGDDTLTGGTGDADYFRFGTNHGADVVTDFTQGVDVIYFNTSVFSTKEEVLAAFSGGVITDAGGTVTLTGIISLTLADIAVDLN